jgi:putative ABC transport system permease protein
MWTSLRRRIAELVQPGRLHRETEEELALHVEQAVEAGIARGMSEQDARRRAALDLGSTRIVQEDLAATRPAFAFEQLWRELRHAARVLGRSPGTTVVSVVTMTVGLGASSALFALVDSILLRPLPYPQPEALVRVFDTNERTGVERSGVATGNLFEWRTRTSAFSGMAGYYAMGRTISNGVDAASVVAAQVTDDFFPVAGVAPMLGRTFIRAEFEAATFSSAAMPTGSNPVVVLAERLWRSRFGGDPAIVGRTVQLERLPFTVIGIMPEGFALPSAEVQAWIPWRIDGTSPRDQHYVGAIARMAARMTLNDAEQRLASVAAELAAAYPATNEGWSVRLVPLHEDVVGASSNVLWLMLAAVGLLLLVACANVALMTFTRGLDRAGEAAVRLALGASPPRLVREFLMESAILSAAAGTLGLALAWATIRALPTLAPDLPRLAEVRLSPLACLFALGATTVSAVLSGLPHAWRRARLNPIEALSDASLRTTRAGSHTTLRHAVAAAQVALSVVLLTGAGLLVRSVQALSTAETGFDARGVLVVPVFLDSQAYKNGDQTRTYYRTLRERLAALPTVTSVAGATTVPTSPLGPDFARPVWRQDSEPGGAARVPAAVRIVTSGYPATMGLRLAAGRAIDDRDSAASPRVVMVSEGLARQLWPGETAVGRQLVVDYSTAGTYPYEVVGVVGDVRFRGPRSSPEREIYLAHAQRPYLTMNVVVKSSGDPRRLVPGVLRAMREIDPNKPPQAAHALEDLLQSTYARDRLTMTVLVGFGTTATFLAMLSVYGVLSRLVRERTRDIAVRMAMGASGVDLLKWVSRIGARLVVSGVVLGLMATVMASRTMERFLFGVEPTDPYTAAAVVVLVSVVGGIATVLPWYRASTVDPLAILRRG